MIDDTNFERVIRLFQSVSIRWAVCGGWAIDLFLNRQTRSRKDLDVTILRTDQLTVQQFLVERGWELQKVALGKLEEWYRDGVLELPIHNVWCDHADYPKHYLEVLFSEASDPHYLFRKDPGIRLPLSSAFVTSQSGIPILAPEIVLLFKSRHLEEDPTCL